MTWVEPNEVDANLTKRSYSKYWSKLEISISARSGQEGYAMRTCIRNWSWLAGLLLVAGCNQQVADPSGGRKGLTDQGNTDLAQLLGKPRSELAAKAKEIEQQLQAKRKAISEGKGEVVLVKDLPPFVMPVFREADYRDKIGLSLPTYVAEDAKDSDVAVQLARFGDGEGAGKLVDPSDTAAARQIEGYRCDKNYPVEWTRLVAIMLHSAESQLAADDADAGSELISLHKQLLTVLDEKAQKGALGAALLPRGRDVLSQAGSAWKAAKLKALAEQATRYIREWGEAKGPIFGIPFGATVAQVQRLLHSQAKESLVPATNLNRALDLLGLPFPEDGIESVLTELNDAKQLSDVYITYRPGIASVYRTPALLAHTLVERGYSGEDVPKAPGLERRIYTSPEGGCSVMLVRHGAGLGALVHLRKGSAAKERATLSRDFGALNLERSFEQNRLLIAPQQRGEAVNTEDQARLAAIENPFPTLKLSKAGVERQPNTNLTLAFAMAFVTGSAGAPPLHSFVLPLWVKYGPPEFHGVHDQTGDHLLLSWKDSRTEYDLRLPYENAEPVQFEVRAIGSTTAEETVDKRMTRALAFDRKERDDRLAAKKPARRLPRQLESLELGMAKGRALELLPAGRANPKRDMPDGITVTLTDEGSKNEARVARQFFVRFGADEKVVEVRARYEAGPASRNTNNWMKTLRESLSKSGGAPQEIHADWAGLWDDSKAVRRRIKEYYWIDDLTLATLQTDDFGAELRIRDCPPEYPLGIPLPPLAYLKRGPEPLVLSQTLQEVTQAWGVVQQEKSADGGLVLRPPSGSQYNVILVYFDQVGVSRIVAQHAAGRAKRGTQAEWQQAIVEAWNRDPGSLGWYRRQEFSPNDLLQGMGWNDDRTRLRIFWAESSDGSIHAFTEWKNATSTPAKEEEHQPSTAVPR
jgi:hypothetical protein